MKKIEDKQCKCERHPARWDSRKYCWKCMNCGKLNKCFGKGEVDKTGNYIMCCPVAPHKAT